MKIICEKDKLLKAINAVVRGVPTRTTMPILEGIYIQTNTNELKLTTYDLELGIEYIIKAEIIEEDEDEFEDLNAKVDQLEDFYNEIHDKEIDEEEELENEDAFSDDEFEGVITQLSKQNTILYLRDTFNSISTMKPAFMMKIQKLNGDQVISGINSIILSELKAIK